MLRTLRFTLRSTATKPEDNKLADQRPWNVLNIKDYIVNAANYFFTPVPAGMR